MSTCWVYFIPPYGNPVLCFVLCVCYSSGRSYAYPGVANLLKHLNFIIYKTHPDSSYPLYKHLFRDTPPVNLTALCTLRVFVGIVVRYIVDKRACVRQDDVQVAAALKVHVQGGFNVLLQLTPITQFHQLFRAERNKSTFNAA